MKILFICRHNKFRSKVAEDYFNKKNKNKKLIAKSAGIFPGRYPLDKQQTEVAKRLGITLKGKPQAITTNLLRWKDVVIAITDDLPKGLFNYGPYKNKVINWKIPDEENGNEKNVEKIIKQIMKKVEALVK
jgi:protein-tyrosine-phosphatase